MRNDANLLQSPPVAVPSLCAVWVIFCIASVFVILDAPMYLPPALSASVAVHSAEPSWVFAIGLLAFVAACLPVLILCNFKIWQFVKNLNDALTLGFERAARASLASSDEIAVAGRFELAKICFPIELARFYISRLRGTLASFGWLCLLLSAISVALCAVLVIIHRGFHPSYALVGGILLVCGFILLHYGRKIARDFPQIGSTDDELRDAIAEYTVADRKFMRPYLPGTQEPKSGANTATRVVFPIT